MSALEQSPAEDRFVEQFRQFSNEQKERIILRLQQVQQETETPKVTTGEWLKEAIAISEALRLKYGDDYTFGTQALIDELRDE